VLEFKSFVYLDVQKTGSGFVVRALHKYCSERLIRRKRHWGVDRDYDPGKFYFISVRNPLDQYISLYSFACQNSGGTGRRIGRLTSPEMFDGTWNGFRSWLSFVLDPENADTLSGNKPHKLYDRVSPIIGFQSYRVLALSIPDAGRALADVKTKEELRALYNAQNIVQHAIRNETLRADLEELFSTRLRNSISDLDGALNYVRTGEPRNASDRVDRKTDNPTIDKQQMQLLQDREWLLHEAYGY